jgi:hypothetical protein
MAAPSDTQIVQFEALKTELAFYRDFFWAHQNRLVSSSSTHHQGKHSNESDNTPTQGGAVTRPFAVGYRLQMSEAQRRELEAEAVFLHDHYQGRLAEAESRLAEQRKLREEALEANLSLRQELLALRRERRATHHYLTQGPLWTETVQPLSIALLCCYEHICRMKVEAEAFRFLLQASLMMATSSSTASESGKVPSTKPTTFATSKALIEAAVRSDVSRKTLQLAEQFQPHLLPPLLPEDSVEQPKSNHTRSGHPPQAMRLQADLDDYVTAALFRAQLTLQKLTVTTLHEDNDDEDDEVDADDVELKARHASQQEETKAAAAVDVGNLVAEPRPLDVSPAVAHPPQAPSPSPASPAATTMAAMPRASSATAKPIEEQFSTDPSAPTVVAQQTAADLLRKFYGKALAAPASPRYTDHIAESALLLDPLVTANQQLQSEVASLRTELSAVKRRAQSSSPSTQDAVVGPVNSASRHRSSHHRLASLSSRGVRATEQDGSGFEHHSDGELAALLHSAHQDLLQFEHVARSTNDMGIKGRMVRKMKEVHKDMEKAVLLQKAQQRSSGKR